MIVDAHTHIFPPSIREDRSRFFSLEPAFRMLYDSPKASMVGTEDLIEAMNQNHVDRAVTFGFPWHSLSTAKMANDYVLEAMERFPERITGFACLYPGVNGAQKEIERCIKAGMKGVGELAFYLEGMDAKQMIEAMAPIVEVCKDLKVPILLHVNETIGHVYPGKTDQDLRDIYLFLKNISPLPIILAHWGGGLVFYELLKKEVPDVLKNVYYDTAASPFLYREEIYSIAIQICGEEKIVFGSDYPLIPPQRYIKEMERSGISIEARSKICGQNIKRILNINN